MQKNSGGKVVRQVTIFEDADYGPEVNFAFTDGTNFNFCVKSGVEAKLTLDEGGEPRVLQNYSNPITSFVIPVRIVPSPFVDIALIAQAVTPPPERLATEHGCVARASRQARRCRIIR